MMKLDESVAMIGGMRSTQDQRVVEDADGEPAGERRRAARRAIMASCVSMIFIATEPASVMVAGIDRSTLPGPSVMTNIWPMPTMTKKVAKVSAAVSSSPPPWPPREGDGREPDQERRDEGPEPGLARAGARERRHRRFSTRSMIARAAPARGSGSRPARRSASRAGCCMKVRNGAGERQRQRADHRADRRDAAADELAAAEDDAGDRVAACSARATLASRRGGEADQRTGRPACRRSRPARTSSPWS